MATKMNRKGISNVVATIILIAVAIALAVAVAVWVFGLAGSASKTATLQVQAVGLTGVSAAISSSSGGTANLTLLISNPSSSGIGINGFTLGSLSCVFNQPIQIPAGTQGVQIVIGLKVTTSSSSSTSSTTSSSSSSTTSSSTPTSGNFTGLGYFGNTQYDIVVNGQGQSITATCSGTQAAQVGIQYSGYITTVSGQTYPFTVTASS